MTGMFDVWTVRSRKFTNLAAFGRETRKSGVRGLKPRKLESWRAWLVGDLHCDIDFCPPVRPSQAFLGLLLVLSTWVGSGKLVRTNIPTPRPPSFLSIRHTLALLNISHS